ncbi:uncharacterized protein LOC135692242 isoform X1 [Rhopilema esculentum]|uniref:uncharacterized protein LOC135692242 isoform X1 n=1 Tax=Rhopilema esculentum TaxID=499914 RepID=UPI0031D4DEA8
MPTMEESQQTSSQRRAEISKLLPIRALNTNEINQNTSCIPAGDRLVLASEICNKILQLKEKDEDDKFVVIKSSYGFGKTTLLNQIADEVTKRGGITQNEVWALNFDQNSSMETIFGFFAQKAEVHGLQLEQQMLRKTHLELRRRLEAAFKVLFYCKLLILDDADASDFFDFAFLNEIANKDLIICFSCIHFAKDKFSNCSVYEIPCRNQADVDADFYKQLLLQYGGKEKEKLSSLARKLGPLYGKIFILAINQGILNLEEEQEVMEFCSEKTSCNKMIECFFSRLFSHLTLFDQQLLLSISAIRVPLPIADKNMFKNLVELGVCQKIQTASKKFAIQSLNSVKQIIRALKLECQYGDDGNPERPDMLFLWMLLLPDILKDLIKKAEDHSWPFVPEAWQYKAVITEQERYNLKDIIHQRNKFADFEEIEILQECLYSALVDKNYSSAAAILFIMDRFIYWQGSSKYLINLTDYIQRNSIGTAIPPQIVIRKARIMKNEGDIQGADKVLNSLMQSGQGVGRWVYKSTSDYKLVSSVCVQIKGDIYRGLGLWVEAAKDLIKSIIGFKTLPKADIKGWASSLSLLADAYQYMPLKDYTEQMKMKFGLSSSHPVLEAIKCVNEAADLSIYSPLFYAKNKRRAGELMYIFSRTLPAYSQEQLYYLQCAATELMSGLQCHTSIASLESREQFYEFVFCAYKLAQVVNELKKLQLEMSLKVSLKNTGTALMSLSKKLYERYCSFPARVQHDKQSIMFIQSIMAMLNLPKIPLQEISLQKNLPEKVPEQSKVNREESETKERSLSKDQPKSRMGHDGSTEEAEPKSPKQADRKHLKEENFSSIGVGFSEQTSHIERVGFQDQATLMTEDTEELGATNDASGTDAKGFSRSYNTAKTEEDLETADGGYESQLRNATTASETDVVVDAFKEFVVVDRDDAEQFRNATTASSMQTDDGIEEPRGVENEESAGSGEDSGMADIQNEATYLTEEDFTTTEDFKMRLRTTLATIDDHMATCERDQLQIEDALNIINQSQPKVHDAVVWRYDSIAMKWFSMETLAYIGNKLVLGEKEGACRDAYMVEYLNQEEPFGRYVGKQYKIEKYKDRPKSMQQYKQDVICQVTSRYYATKFNQKIYQKGLLLSQVQFLPAVVVELSDVDSDPERYFNVEPYMAGSFTKITNNFKWVIKDNIQGKELLLAFSHFSYCISNGKMLIVDIQGWTSDDNSGVTFLTDPQIHTPDKKGFGSANRGLDGFSEFWASQHPKCNDVCKALSLKRP